VLRIGLTGGIGAGKSAVAGRLREQGAVLIDSDLLAREVVAAGGAGLAAVVEVFGPGVLLPGGELDRAKLGGIVFGDPEARAALNAIVHPLVGARTAELVAAAPDGAIVVHDVPLLVENHLAPNYHLVVVVDAPEAVRLERLARTRGMSEADARARIGAQAGPEQRAAAADALIRNDRDLPALHADVDRLWRRRLAPYAANLAADAEAPYGPDSPPPGDADFGRAAARLKILLNGLGVRLRRADDPVLLRIEAELPTGSDVITARHALRGSGWTAWREGRAGEWLAGHADPGRPARLSVAPESR
jgi:dephospho-CoA kinase